MGKKARIKELEDRCDKLDKALRHAQADINRLLVWQKVIQRQKENEEDDAFEANGIGVSTPGVWRIRCDAVSKDPKRSNPLWWWDDANSDLDSWREGNPQEVAAEYHSLIEAVRALAKVSKPPKGYHKPVVVEPSGGTYNERDGRDPDAKPIEPKVVETE